MLSWLPDFDNRTALVTAPIHLVFVYVVDDDEAASAVAPEQRTKTLPPALYLNIRVVIGERYAERTRESIDDDQNRLPLFNERFEGAPAVESQRLGRLDVDDSADLLARAAQHLQAAAQVPGRHLMIDPQRRAAKADNLRGGAQREPGFQTFWLTEDQVPLIGIEHAEDIRSALRCIEIAVKGDGQPGVRSFAGWLGAKFRQLPPGIVQQIGQRPIGECGSLGEIVCEDDEAPTLR